MMNSHLTDDALIEFELPNTYKPKEIDPNDYMKLFELLYGKAPDLTGFDDYPPLRRSSDE